jgi:hypothetical protein
METSLTSLASMLTQALKLHSTFRRYAGWCSISSSS